MMSSRGIRRVATHMVIDAAAAKETAKAADVALFGFLKLGNLQRFLWWQVRPVRRSQPLR